MAPMEIILYSLATYRLSYLIVHDDITIRLRMGLHNVPIISNIITCMSCCSIWMAMLSFCLPEIIIWILALSGATILMNTYVEQ